MEKSAVKTCPQALWKSYFFAQYACVKKAVAALSKNRVFHIKIPYGYYYCITYLFLYLLYYLARKEEPICVLPVKKVCWYKA